MKKIISFGVVAVLCTLSLGNVSAGFDVTADIGDPIEFTTRLRGGVEKLVTGATNIISPMDYWRMSGDLDQNYKENMRLFYGKVNYWVDLSRKNWGKFDSDDINDTKDKLKAYCEWYEKEYQDIQSFKTTYNKWHRGNPIKSSGANFFRSCSAQNITSVLAREVKDCMKRAGSGKSCKKEWGD